MTSPPIVLVTGATGYIASLLIPRLLEMGYHVRCMARDADRAAGQSWHPEVEVVFGDVTRAETLSPVLKGVWTAFYLIHNMSIGEGYTQVELVAAQNFANEAAKAGVEHIIYLGGLADPQTDLGAHMRSRIETGMTLRQGRIPVTELRAGVIVGPGSISFEMIRHITEQFPLLVGPRWLENLSQPISAMNVVDYLVAAMETPACRGRIFEIGGPDVMTYKENMLTYASIRGLRRRLFAVPYIPVRMMAFIVDRLTPVPESIARALIGGLSSNSIVTDQNAVEVFKSIQLIAYQDAVVQALKDTAPACLVRVWEHTPGRERVFSKEGFFFCLHDAQLDVSPELVYAAIEGFVQQSLPDYQVEVKDEGRALLICKEDRWGKRWVEFTLEPTQQGIQLIQMGFFSPKGLAGYMRRSFWHAGQRRMFNRVLQAFHSALRG